MARPYLCPVCKGKGVVPIDFYGPREISSVMGTITCKTCSGIGVLWDYSDVEYKYYPPVWCGGPHLPQDINKTMPPQGTVVNDDLGGAK